MVNHKYCIFLYGPFKLSVPLVLNMGDDLEECKSNLFSILKVMERKIPFQYIQPLVYNIYIYINFKYRNFEFYLYLEGGGASARRRCVACWQSPKDLRETIHHLIPMLCEGFLNQQFERIYCPIIFFSLAMRGLLGMQEIFSSRETSSRPNSLYYDLVGDMH